MRESWRWLLRATRIRCIIRRLMASWDPIITASSRPVEDEINHSSRWVAAQPDCPRTDHIAFTVCHASLTPFDGRRLLRRKHTTQAFRSRQPLAYLHALPLRSHVTQWNEGPGRTTGGIGHVSADTSSFSLLQATPSGQQATELMAEPAATLAF